MSQTASQETQTSNLSERRENFWMCAKKPAKLNNLSLFLNKWQLSLEWKLNKNHFDLYIQWLEFSEDSAMVKPSNKGYNL